MPKTKYPLGFSGHDTYVNLNAGTNDVYTGRGAEVPDSYFRLYSNTPGARTLTGTIGFTTAFQQEGNCQNYAIKSSFIVPNSLGGTLGQPIVGGQSSGTVPGCNYNWSINVPANAWTASAIPGQGGLYFTVLHLSIDDFGAQTHSAYIRVDSSGTSPDTRITTQSGDYSYTTIFPQVYRAAPPGNYTISLPFAPACGQTPSGGEHLQWGDDDYPSANQPAGSGLRVDLIVTNRITGASNSIPLANSSIGGFTNNGSRYYGPPPGYGWSSDYTYNLQFSNVYGGNGIWVVLPFDEGNAYTPCPIPHSPPPTCSEVAVANPGIGNQELVWVQDSQNNVLVPSGGSNPSSASPTTTNYSGDAGTGPSNFLGTRFFIVGRNGAGGGTWLYTVQGQNVRVVEIVRHWTGTKYQTTAYNDVTINCYNASLGACSLSATGDGPNNVVVEGGTIHVSGVVYNTGPGDLPASISGHPLQFNNGDENGNGGDFSFNQNVGAVPYAGAQAVSFNLPAPTSATPYTKSLIAHPAYSGLFAFGPGSACGITVNVYAPFSLSPTANVNLVDATGAIDTENPTQVVNTTYVTESGAPVSEPVTSKLYYTTSACGTTSAAAPRFSTSKGGPFNAGVTYLYQPPSTPPESTYPVCSSPLAAGDTYCAEIDVPVDTVGGNQAYVGPGGDLVGGQPNQSINCPKVVNEPYTTVYNSSVSTGDGFATGGVCKGGELASWNNNSGINPPEAFGAGTQLNALATLGITGFASAQNTPPTLNGPPTNLSFSNTTNVTGGGQNSPSLGGNFGATACLQPPQAKTASSALPGPTVDVSTLAPGSYTYTGNLTITNGSSIPAGRDVSIFVTGNAYIAPAHNGIVYGGDGTWSPGQVPSFNLAAQGGNIYIDPGVGELDGTYSAEPDGSGNQGKIYTCSDTTNHFTFMAKDSLYDNCKKQLVVYGAFQANQVNLMRTFGSLRNDTPIPGVGSAPGVNGVTAPLVWSYGPADPVPSGYTCTIVREFSPPQPASTSWGDNQLCVKNGDPATLGWTTNAVAPEDPSAPSPQTNTGLPMCTSSWGSVVAPYGYPHDQTTGFWWDDNYLCSNASTLSFVISPGDPSNAAQYCTNITEPSDPNGGGLFQDVNPAGKPWVCISKYVAPVIGGPAHQPLPPTCSNNAAGGLLATTTCAAEVFDFSPDLYLSNPATQLPSHGALKFQAETSLPPVL
ncbi:MAG TPA: hypothetical protein VIJ68_04810 [Candidatus Saccharimonadales bacterium]